jgi:hypothetical protein
MEVLQKLARRQVETLQAILGIVAAFLYFLGFRAVKVVEPQLCPATVLAVLGLVGFALALVGEGLLLGGVVSAFGPPSSPAAALTALGGLALLGLGLVLTFLGSFGLAYGNWHVGARDGQGSIKCGAILSFVPVISGAGFVLCSLGYLIAGHQLAQHGSSGTSTPAP